MYLCRHQCPHSCLRTCLRARLCTRRRTSLYTCLCTVLWLQSSKANCTARLKGRPARLSSIMVSGIDNGIQKTPGPRSLTVALTWYATRYMPVRISARTHTRVHAGPAALVPVKCGQCIPHYVCGAQAAIQTDPNDRKLKILERHPGIGHQLMRFKIT